jgi:hypothetical protein
MRMLTVYKLPCDAAAPAAAAAADLFMRQPLSKHAHNSLDATKDMPPQLSIAP